MSHHYRCAYNGLDIAKMRKLQEAGGITDLGLEDILDRVDGCPNGCRAQPFDERYPALAHAMGRRKGRP